MQFAGAVSAVQLRFVPELVVPDAANPAGAAGVVVQLPPLPPVPLRAAVCGLFEAPSVTVSVPLAAPEEVGAKYTYMGHEPWATTEDPQLLDTTNGPLTVTLLMLTAELPLLDRVKVNQAVPVPTGVLPKFSLAGLRVRVWAMSVNGASSETATRISMRLQTKLIGMLLIFVIVRVLSYVLFAVPWFGGHHRRDPAAVLGD